MSSGILKPTADSLDTRCRSTSVRIIKKPLMGSLGLTPGDATDFVGRSIRTVVVDDYDFERMLVQRGLHGVYQSDDALNFIERRYDDSKL